MAKLVTNGLNLNKTALLNALLHPVPSDPSSPAEGQVWYREDTDRVMVQANGAAKAIAFLDDVTAGSVTGALWDAQSVVTSVLDDSPSAQIMPPSTVLGRTAGGDIGPLTKSQLLTLLNAEDGATADQTLGDLTGLGLATQTYADNAATAAATAAVDAAIDGAPGALDTLNEIAAAMGDDPNFAATITASIAAKASKVAGNIGDGTNTDLVFTHNLGTLDFTIAVFDNATGADVIADVVRTNSNAVTISFAAAPPVGAYRVVVTG